MRDTSAAFLRAVQADYSISGVFNVASDNYTVGQVADLVKDEVEAKLDKSVQIEIKNIQDYRNYKVTCEKAHNTLGFAPKYGITEMVDSLIEHMDEYGDFSNPNFYNIQVFKAMDN